MRKSINSIIIVWTTASILFVTMAIVSAAAGVIIQSNAAAVNTTSCVICVEGGQQWSVGDCNDECAADASCATTVQLCTTVETERYANAINHCDECLDEEFMWNYVNDQYQLCSASTICGVSDMDGFHEATCPASKDQCDDVSDAITMHLSPSPSTIIIAFVIFLSIIQ